MDQARLIKAEAIFNDLLGISKEARAAAIEQRCGSDGALRSLVEHLLASDESGMGDFLRMPVFVSADSFSSNETTGSTQSIGDYEIIRRIGEGGMGVVYEARQANPRRTVALKVLRSALPSSETVSRFRHEAHILAKLRHPGIAHIYEAAVAQVDLGGGIQASQPYFAMEMVEGRPLRAFAEEGKFDIRQRLELMILVCEAVQHAHEKGIIHRDLKSENILVEPSGRPRILDFGVARLLASNEEPQTLHTRAGEIIGTLAYMSPEQAGGDSLMVDTRSDIYALGVILYDLLTGRLPHNVSGMALGEAARQICEVESKAPSFHNLRLRGEVDWIVMKCLEKDRARRYHSAIALAEDIQRYLRNEPVLAGAPTRLYRFGKLVRRNRGIFAAGTAIFALMLVAVIGTRYGLIEAREQRDLALEARADAEREEKNARAVTQFLTRDLLGSIDQNLPPQDRDEKISDVLARAETKLDSGVLANEPETEVAIHEVIGHLQFQLGRLDEAERHSRAALYLYRKLVEPDHPKIVEALLNLGEVMHTRGELLESEALFREAIEQGVLHQTLTGARAFAAHSNYAELLRARGFGRRNYSFEKPWQCRIPTYQSWPACGVSS
ncbi:MAG: serine/threonine protein kinase [Planctomycetes bacterium]|nr:serine/threonine protein kinase [Planctomycetota bacterium]